jgi:hypothetical protein
MRKRWSKGLILVEILLLAATGFCVYGGVLLLSRAHGGASKKAKIVSCEVPDTQNNDGHEVCKGQWTAGDPAHPRTVTGTVEGATFHDRGKTIEIVVTGDHGWTRDSASRLAYPALVFAALFLTIAILLPRG